MRYILPGGVFALMLGAIVFGTWTGFPVFDDAYLKLFVNELGHNSIAAANSNRPICALLLQNFVDIFSLSRFPYVAINLAFWILLAWQTWRLSSSLFVDEVATGITSSIVVLAPILVKTQFTTITTLFQANLPVSICLAVLIYSLRKDIEGRPLFLICAAIFIFTATVLSEYGGAAAAACLGVLIILKKPRTALAIFTGAVIGYFVFQSIGDFSLTQTRTSSSMLETLRPRVPTIIQNFIVDVWQSLIGSFAIAAGKVKLEMDSRSTIFAAIAGLISMAIIVKLLRNLEVKSKDSRRATVALLLAVASGLVPVVLANQGRSIPDSYETRFFIPILPFASIAMVRGVLHLTRSRFHPWIAAILTFVAVYSAWSAGFEKGREQKNMENVGQLLEPFVRTSNGITIGVVPDFEKLGGPDITPKVTWNWPKNLVKRVWVLPQRDAIPLFGPRSACHNSKLINMSPQFLSVGRRGSVSHLLFIADFWTSNNGLTKESFEPYCIEQAALE